MREQNKTDLAQVSPLFQESMLVKIAAKEPKYNDAGTIAALLRLGFSQRTFICATVTAEPFDLSIRQNADALSVEKVGFKLSINC